MTIGPVKPHIVRVRLAGDDVAGHPVFTLYVALTETEQQAVEAVKRACCSSELVEATGKMLTPGAAERIGLTTPGAVVPLGG